MSEHTKEPWKLGGCSGRMVYDAEGYNVADVDLLANAQRIVACVNACSAIKTEDLENHSVSLCGDSYIEIEKERDALEAINAELVAALTSIRDQIASSEYIYAMKSCDSALAKAKEQK